MEFFTMKKTIISLLALLAAGTGAIGAANPFTDVPADSWAYQSVATLASSGIIEGVDESQFQGNRPITRYETAQLLARAMAHLDKATPEQRAAILKLDEEFSAELENLGVRLTSLENKTGRTKLSGDVRLRYMHQTDNFRNHGTKTDDTWQYRARLRFMAPLTDGVRVTIGYSTDNHQFDDGSQASEKDPSFFDIASVTASIGNKGSVTAGRYLYSLGNGMGLQFANCFDGIQGQYTEKNWQFTGGYGQFRLGSFYQSSVTADHVRDSSGRSYHDLSGVYSGYAAIDRLFSAGRAGFYYNQLSGKAAADQHLDYILGGYIHLDLGSNWNLLGDYQRIAKAPSTTANEDAGLYGIQLQYGQTALQKKAPGTPG